MIWKWREEWEKYFGFPVFLHGFGIHEKRGLESTKPRLQSVMKS
jgi:hypothetical protein